MEHNYRIWSIIRLVVAIKDVYESLSFYDLEYMIEAEATEETEGFQIIGAKNVSGTGGIVWNNNTEFETEEEVTEEE